ncbi:MAG TPA: aminotransferase class V-fold PLP-dependent enzyme [Stellaceae bacterium]|nr:aminotransferase class V-fold PLP-dependent enzyme [Stellaceae bacterium]
MTARGAASAAFGAAAREEWPLDPAVAYLNHGGFGVSPNEVLREQESWRRRIERNPTRFFAGELPSLLRDAAAALATYLGAKGEDLVFVDNATAGCNAVLRSLSFAPGDEILVTGLAYGAVLKAARYVAERSGARLVEVEIPLPVADAAAILAAVSSRLGPRTRLAVFDHIASHSALVLPVAELVRLARAAGARVLVDGAHAPGQVPFSLPAIGADWYVGNCHKWLMAPRGCGFLWCEKPLQVLIHPLSISHGYGAGYIAEFDWTGTRDVTPFLALPAALGCHRRLGGEALMARNTALARAAARLLTGRWGTDLAGPESSFAAMAAVRLPLAGEASQERAASLGRWLSDTHRIEAAVNAHSGALWLRLAAQAYNELAEYERLAALW